MLFLEIDVAERSISNADGTSVSREKSIFQITMPTGALEDLFNRMRSILEASFQDPRLRGLPALWRFYIAIEVFHARYVQAKRIFFRAVQACAWVKDLWLLALGPLRRCFDGRELRGMLDAMEEKKLHLRTP